MEGENGESRLDTSQEVQTVDLNHALQRVDGSKDALQELVQIFSADECPQLMRCIRDALVKQDAAVLERSAHTLKSSADLFGAKRAFEAARTLERLASESDFQGAARSWITLEQELASVLAALAKLET